MDMDRLTAALAKLGDTPVYTDVGAVSASEAARLVAGGVAREVVVPSTGTYVRIGPGGTVFVVGELPGDEEAEVTYSAEELAKVKLADLASAAGFASSAELVSAMAAEPVHAAVKAVEAFDKARREGSPLLSGLKSALLNLLDILAELVYEREGESDLSGAVKRLGKSGEFEEVTDSFKLRLHAARSALRMMVGNTRHVYKAYGETGRRYLVVLDKSGSMAQRYAGATKKAYAALVALLIAKADPEAKFTLVAFDRSAKLLLKDADAEEVAETVAEIDAAGGTSYASALELASRVAEDGDVVVVVGDFMDRSAVPSAAAEALREKASMIMLVPAGRADVEYLRYVSEALKPKSRVYVYRRGVFEEAAL